MPEIKNEIPDLQELQSYRDAWLATSSMCILTCDPNEPSFLHLRESMSYLVSSQTCPGFLVLVSDTILESLERLNRLPRDDSFWKNTNLRPTIPKLTWFCAEILKKDPDDVSALMTQVVLDMAHCTELNPEAWVRLFDLGAVSLDAVIFAGSVTEILSRV